MRHKFTKAQQRLGGLLSKGKFRRGADPRRHVFTKAECVRGGLISWTLFMVRFRAGFLPIPEHLRDLLARALSE
jgi:hypothetical protein